ncbi:MAG: acetyltransferase [Candidatus Omnitrophica bacterium]|nr:acetyltransferase [Candidatus Omnitrophota bacterium]
MPAKEVLCVVLGGGGHARVVIDALRASQAATPAAVLDANRSLWNTELLGVPVRGGDDLLPDLLREGIRHFVVGVGGISDNEPRRRLFELALRQGLTPLRACHPSAICSPSAVIGQGTIVFPHAVVNVGARVGSNVIVNTAAVIEHDCVVGDHVHVATRAVLCSTVRVGALAHIGAGATVRQPTSIGEGAVVGAGAVVINDVAPWTVVVGVPARWLRNVQRDVAWSNAGVSDGGSG